MWMDVAKTMISASGIAAALLTSLALGKDFDPLVAHSVKISTVSFVLCVCVSMFLILTLARGHETAKARYLSEQREKGSRMEIREGPLSNFALCLTLAGAFIALSTFFVGFLFLGRIVWHI